MEKLATDIYMLDLRRKGFTYVDKTAQIDRNGRAEKFYLAKKRVVKIGIAFSSERCTITGRIMSYYLNCDRSSKAIEVGDLTNVGLD